MMIRLPGPGCNGADSTGRASHVDHIKRLHAGGLDVLLLNSVRDRGLGENGTRFLPGKDEGMPAACANFFPPQERKAESGSQGTGQRAI